MVKRAISEDDEFQQEHDLQLSPRNKLLLVRIDFEISEKGERD